MNILLVEDEGPKRNNIIRALRTIVSGATTAQARSVSSAIAHLRSATPDLILLDMSLPTFDIGPGEPGGRPQGFGGIEVLRYIDRFGLKVPVIVVTAYEAFSRDGQQIDLDALKSQLERAHPKTFRGVVFYNSLLGACLRSWRRPSSIQWVRNENTLS
jgi:CheY-like chemotaxis protein